MLSRSQILRLHPVKATFLGLAAMAKKLGVSLRSLQRWHRKGMPIYQASPGGKILVRECEVFAFLKRNRYQPHEETVEEGFK